MILQFTDIKENKMSSTFKILCIGDPHFQISNVETTTLFIEKVKNIITERKPNLVVVLGDLLHTHETQHTTPLNKAYQFINEIRQLSLVYVIVGNHDLCNNSQFLTSNHWMNAMKQWSNVVIVDTTTSITLEQNKIVMVPYVPPGRFKEALCVLEEEKEWSKASLIMAHQEFYGCKMGAIVSTTGDLWDKNYPLVISGHIHDKQSPQTNIYYTGSAMQHAFGESPHKSLLMVEMDKGEIVKREELLLGLPKKKIVYLDTGDLKSFKLKKNNTDQIKLTVTGSHHEFKALKKTKRFKDLISEGVKIVFKPEKVDLEINENLLRKSDHGEDFHKIINELVTQENNIFLKRSYDIIFHS